MSFFTGMFWQSLTQWLHKINKCLVLQKGFELSVNLRVGMWTSWNVWLCQHLSTLLNTASSSCHLLHSFLRIYYRSLDYHSSFPKLDSIISPQDWTIVYSTLSLSIPLFENLNTVLGLTIIASIKLNCLGQYNNWMDNINTILGLKFNTYI